MGTLPLALVLMSAVLHASWNLAVKSSTDRLLASAGQVVFVSLLALPFLIANGFPSELWLSVVGSVAIHLIYGLALVAAYNRGDLSLVYPVARGSAPLLVTAVAAMLLDDTPSLGGLIAIVLVAVGVLAMARARELAGLGWALVAGATIATYTLVDGAAVRQLDSAIPYAAALFVGNGIAFAITAAIMRSPREIGQSIRSEWKVNTLAAVASVAAYTLVLTAARLAPLGLVSAFRETSVLFGVLAGWLILHEPRAKQRLPGALLIAAGLFVLVVFG